MKNLTVVLLVLVGDAEDGTYSSAYHLGRIHSLQPHIRRGKEINRRATVTALVKSTVGDPGRITYVLRDLSKIASV